MSSKNLDRICQDFDTEENPTGADRSSDRLEQYVRDRLNANDWDRINGIIDQLCHDFAYAIHQPYARNGGLIGLAAASIALGPVCLLDI